MPDHPGISIITPSYNQAGYIEETILSILDQETNFPVEYIVTDGGSDDGTIEILTKYRSRLTWVSEKDRGQSDAVNKGVNMAAAEIIGWLNSDDVYLPGTLQKVYDAFKKDPELKWLYGTCRIIDEEGHEKRKWIISYINSLSRKYNYSRLLLQNYISQPAVFFKKEAFLEAGSLDLSLDYAMDYDLWLRLSRLGEPAVIHEDLALFRLHNRSKSTKKYHKLLNEQYLIHKRYDQTRSMLLKHRFHIAKTVTAYTILDIFRRLGN